MHYTPREIPADLVTVMAMMAPEAAERIATTFQFVAAAHDGQLRDEGTPFVDHPVAVVDILWSELGCRDVDVLLAALAHDVLEDCDWVTVEALSDLVGSRACEMVQHVTKVRVPRDERDRRDEAYLDSLASLPLESRLLKIADRIHNLRCVVLANDDDKARRYLEVSRERFYPLALSTDATAARLIADACDAIERHLGNQPGGAA